MIHVIEFFARSLKIIGNTLYSTIRQIAYEFLSAFHSNYSPILYHFRDKARYWSKIAIFHTQPAFKIPLGVSVGILPKRLIQKKN